VLDEAHVAQGQQPDGRARDRRVHRADVVQLLQAARQPRVIGPKRVEIEGDAVGVVPQQLDRRERADRHRADVSVVVQLRADPLGGDARQHELRDAE